MSTRPVFPDVAMNLVRPGAPVTARVVSNESCMNGKSASFVKHLVIDVGGTPLAGAVAAGQSFGVVAPGTDEHGKAHKVRLYSNASPAWGEDGGGRLISTTPKRLIDEYDPAAGDAARAHKLFLGVCSNYLCDLRPGEPVKVSGPNGQRFLLPTERDAHDYLFLATGTGIAPFRGMLIELLEHPDGPCRSRIDLVVGTPYTSDLLYHDLLSALAARHENFCYHTAISREAPAGRAHGRYVHDLVERTFDHFAPLLGGERTLIYACGLEGMRYGLARCLASRGLGDDYFRVGEKLAGQAPRDWSDMDIRRHVKPGARSFLEVY
ncbi:MAG: FAD-binding oxidoreductase [Gammaproteobacteria bacterium]